MILSPQTLGCLREREEGVQTGKFMIYVKEFTKTAKKPIVCAHSQKNAPIFAADFKITVCENMRINV